MHFRPCYPGRFAIVKYRKEAYVEKSSCFSSCQLSTVAVTKSKLSEDCKIKELKHVIPVDEKYHRLMFDLSQPELKNVYPYFQERDNQILLQNEIQNVVRMMRIYEELVSELTEDDVDQILRIYSDKLMKEEKAILWSVGQGDTPAQKSEQQGEGLPSREQLLYIQESLAAQLPQLFKKPLDYRIYHKDVVFVNNIRGTKCVGLTPYVKQVAWLRILGHLKFSYVRFEILKITSHPDEGTVKVRWRISGVSGLRSMFMFWNIRLWDYKNTREQMSESWYDGFSTFKVGSDGLVHLHIADKVMPDDERTTEKVPLAVKLAALIGLMPRPSVSDFSVFFEGSDIKKSLEELQRIQKTITDV